MRIVIDIPEETKQAFDRANNNDINFCFYDYNSVVGKAIKNGTVLPDNPTNGDMIMTVFPNASITEIGGGSTIVVANDYKFNSTWWNAPYREDGETE